MKLISLFLIAIAVTAKAAPIRSAGCAETAEAAVTAMLTNSITDNVSHGFRVDAIHVDLIRHRKWALIASCTESSKPLLALPLPDSRAVSSEVQREALAVRTGDHVVVMSRSGDSRMRLTGSALESGVVGQKVRVRLDLALENTVKPTIECEILQSGLVEASR